MGDVHDPGSGEFTWAAWIRADTIDRVGFVFHKGNSSTGTGGIVQLNVLSDNKMRIGVFVGGWEFISSTNTISVDTWYYCVFRRDSSDNITLYVNDTSWASGTKAGEINNANDFVVGAQELTAGIGASSFTGKIDEVAVWSRAITTGEMTELYNSGAGLQYPFVPPGDITSTYEGGLLRGDAPLLAELDTLSTGALTAGTDTTSIVLLPAGKQFVVEVYTLTRSS